MLCGFTAIRRVRRRQTPDGAALAVFTTWIVPVLLVCGIAVSVAADSSRGSDQQTAAVAVVGLLTLLAGFAFMGWEHFRLVREHRASAR
ncbi:MAG: hypothetical protein KAI24_23900, partial [Planctomycetes bacterium]|nr:hypothetical protein [Planctomycetota bacterium]